MARRVPTLQVDGTLLEKFMPAYLKQAMINLKADKATAVNTGTGLSGGGDLSASRTITVVFGSTAGTVTQGNDSRLSDARTPLAHTHVLADMPTNWAKEKVRVATTANITLSGAQTIDGVAVVAGDRVLVKNQTTASQNGIYVVASGSWTRATDADTAVEAASAEVPVASGGQGGRKYRTNFKSTDTIGTTAMSWFEAPDSGSLTKASVGLSNVDNTSDANKPVSGPQQTALNLKADKSTTVSAGTGLSGGGDLSANRSLSVVYGSTAGTAAQGNDPRLSDARTPTAHNHGVGDLPVAASGESSATKVVRADDARLSDARTPTAHTHNASDVTGGQFATARLGSGTASASSWLRGDGVWASPPVQSLAVMTDVTLTSAANGQFLAYNGTKWVNRVIDAADVATGVFGLARLPVASSGTSSATQLVRADDSRLSNARTPVAHTHSLADVPDAWVKKSVRVATTANITLSGTQTIDGIAVVAGDRVLVKNQTTTSANGIYTVASGVWTRTAGADTAAEIAGAAVAVQQGTQGGTVWVTTFKSDNTLGSTAMNWDRIYRKAEVDAIVTTLNADISTKADNTAIVNSLNLKANKSNDTLTGATLAGTSTVGASDTDVAKNRAVEVETHSRSYENIYTDGVLTQTLEKSGTTTVKTVIYNYTGSQLSSITETIGGLTITTTFNYSDDGVASITRSVI